MGSMLDKMIKEKAIPISSVKRSREIVKQISRADVVGLNRTLQPIIEQNKREHIATMEAVSRDDSYYRGSQENVSQPRLVKKL